MKKPPCVKCGSNGLYLEPPQLSLDQPSLACYACGWRIYGEPAIRTVVERHNAKLKEDEKKARDREAQLQAAAAAAAERARLEKSRALKRERDRRYRERKKARDQIYIIPSIGVRFRIGEIDPVLQLPWARPLPNKEGEDLHPCAWPPCEQRARTTSRYCSRKCGVKVAHQRARLRKEGKLSEQQAS